MAEIVNRRTQNSPLRRAQAAATRARITEAAAVVFATSGFERARIEDIAKQAGVAYPTVYKAFGNKPALLSAAVTTAMSGGPETDIERQAWFQEQLDAPDAQTQLRLIARNARRLYDRAGRLLETVRMAAAVDENIDALWHAINDDRVKRSHTTAKRLATKTRLRASIPATARTVWALTLPEIYVLQVHHGQLAPDEYERWLADLLVGAILA
jgi:TetR/AcrR family transcriptional regulator, regulator of autoinduction and epiphytic fitness